LLQAHTPKKAVLAPGAGELRWAGDSMLEGAAVAPAAVVLVASPPPRL